MPHSDIERLYALITGLREDFTDKWEQSIQQTSGVASDVKDLKRAFDEHLREDLAFKNEMRPVLNGKRFVTYLGDFFKFFGVPVAAVAYWAWNKL